MHPLNIFFDKVFVINLTNRKDRRDAIEARMKKFGIEFEFFNAVEYGWAKTLLKYIENEGKHIFKTPGEFGCMQSHYSCIKIAKERGYKNVLIFEDDTVFLKNFNDIIQEYLDNLPTNWDMIYLSCNIWKFSASNNWFKESYWRFANHCNAACAYAVNSPFYNKVLKYLDDNFNVVDVSYMELQNDPNNLILFAIPNLTMQGWSKSDLIGQETNYFHEGILSYAGKKPENYE